MRHPGEPAPFLVFKRDSNVYAGGMALSGGAALIGGIRAVLQVMRLELSVAMRPPTPPFRPGRTNTTRRECEQRKPHQPSRPLQGS